ncbi:hypothetical protein FRC03_007582 [Tulasnella sp. 419]|nr:hypothetical protein FRC03_007582 [Tulasnella sp. 419]
MEAVLAAHALKPFTKALVALSKYGDDLDIHATPDHLSLSSTNSSKSAYGRFRLLPHFFEKYSVGDPFRMSEDDVTEIERVDGQVLVKSILSILRPKASFEKTVERCEFSIIPGHQSSSAPQATGGSTSTSGSPQSILLIRLHCKYEITKTHRLPLNAPPVFVAPHIPPSPLRAHVVVGPRAVKDLVDHFSKTKSKSVKSSDVQLAWAWSATEVVVKTSKGFADRNSDAHISTSISMQADEFDSYEIPNAPVSLSFHLREFIAATGLAESLSLQLNLSFTVAPEPLCITIDADTYESIFVIATKTVPGAPSAPPPAAVPISSASNKRPREPELPMEHRKSMKVVTVEPNPSVSSSLASRRAEEERSSGSRTPVKSSARPSATSRTSQLRSHPTAAGSPSWSLSDSVEQELQNYSPSRRDGAQGRMPLFLPSTQATVPPMMSQRDQEIIRASGLKIEDMTSAELDDMFNYDGEEDELTTSPVKSKAARKSTNSFKDAHPPEQWPNSPNWDSSTAQDSRQSRTATSSGRQSLRSSVPGVGNEELAEMEQDPNADVDMEDEESVPPTQLPVKVVTRGKKVMFVHQ